MALPDGCSGRCDRLSAREVMPVGRFPMLFLATAQTGRGHGLDRSALGTERSVRAKNRRRPRRLADHQRWVHHGKDDTMTIPTPEQPGPLPAPGPIDPPGEPGPVPTPGPIDPPPAPGPPPIDPDRPPVPLEPPPTPSPPNPDPAQPYL
jgi:hypothetical protein